MAAGAPRGGRDEAAPGGPARAREPMDAQAFLRGVAKGKPAAVYALVGDESFFKDRIVAALRKRVLGPDSPASAVRTVSARRAPGEPPIEPHALFDELRTGSLFEPVRLVRVEGADALVEAAAEALEAYVASPAAQVHLVLDLDKLDGRTRFARRIAEAGVVIACRRPFDHPPPWQPDAEPWDHPLAAWLVEEARSQGLALDKPAAHAIVERVGSEPGLLAREAERLAAVLGGTPAAAKPLAADGVASLVADTRGEDLFRLADAIARRDLSAALKVADALFRDGVPEREGGRTRGEGPVAARIVPWVHRTLRELWVARGIADSGGAAAEVARALGKKPVFAEALLRDARRFEPREFERAWPRLLATDLAVKGGSPPRLAVETFLMEAVPRRP
ncbi:MAG: DNA polymerase III subunit delta [Planctomycetales bacterium]|nr:DNA polymerase III subunit delta [Planctomycetales bacterium]